MTEYAKSNLMHKLHNLGRTPESDECYTPPEAVMPLLPYLNKDIRWYECTSGISSQMVNTLKAGGVDVVSSEGRDFLTDDFDDYDAIITNPPFSKKDKFIKRCYELGKPFALLLPVTTLQGKARGKWFDKHGVEIMALSSRIDFTGKGSPSFGVAWFCYGILPEKLMFHNDGDD